jgi:phosphatidylglycerophosphate synthase
LSRDVIILTSAAVIILVAGYRPFPPTLYGKIATSVQILLVFVVVTQAVVNQPALEALRGILVYLVAGFTVLSGFHYSVIIARRLQGS